MKIWKKWCKKVEEHNKPLLEDWATSDEIWSPYTIFAPIIFGVFLFIYLGFFMLASDSGCNWTLCAVLSLFGAMILGLGMLVSWKAYS